jgi:hypothetical protein
LSGPLIPKDLSGRDNLTSKLFEPLASPNAEVKLRYLIWCYQASCVGGREFATNK